MWKCALFLTTCISSIYAATIQVVPMDPTPEPDHVRIEVLHPKEEEVESSGKIRLQVLIEGYGLGVNSQFDRNREIYNRSVGQVMRVAIDNYPHFDLPTTAIDALDLTYDYFDFNVEMKMPLSLDSGEHIMRVYAARSFGESLKGDKSVAIRTFYVKTKKDTPQLDASKPFITYNEPQGEIKMDKDGAILLDFLVSNCILSQDGYKVRAKIDKKMERVFTKLVPYYIYGLSSGSHEITIELLDRNNKVVEGALSSATRAFSIREK